MYHSASFAYNVVAHYCWYEQFEERDRRLMSFFEFCSVVLYVFGYAAKKRKERSFQIPFFVGLLIMVLILSSTILAEHSIMDSKDLSVSLVGLTLDLVLLIYATWITITVLSKLFTVALFLFFQSFKH